MEWNGLMERAARIVTGNGWNNLPTFVPSIALHFSNYPFMPRGKGREKHLDDT